MNTRQKLTLGIAAIFMVTLTIVGVTYAFFVTRVNTPTGNTTVDVQTATLASVEYAEGNGLVTMDNVIPGDVEYKAFRVLNNNANQSQYSVILASAKNASDVSFVHSDESTITTVCYDAKAYDVLHSTADDRSKDETLAEKYTTLNSTCYEAGVAYNSIKYDLYEVTSQEYATISEAADSDTKDDAIGTLVAGKTAKASGNVLEGTGSYDGAKIRPGTAQVILNNATINAGTQNGETVTPYEVYYVLKITYEEETQNQNIENRAALGILVSID